ALPSGHPFGSPRAGLPDSRTRPSSHSVFNHRRVPGPPPHVLAHRSGQARVAPRRVSLIIRRLAVPRRPNRVRYPTDWPFTLLLLSTPPRGGAVAGGYRSTLDTSGEDFHLSDQVRSQAHRFFAALRMTCELTSDATYRVQLLAAGRFHQTLNWTDASHPSGTRAPQRSGPPRRSRCLRPNPISDIRNSLRRRQTRATKPQPAGSGTWESPFSSG